MEARYKSNEMSVLAAASRALSAQRLKLAPPTHPPTTALLLLAQHHQHPSTISQPAHSLFCTEELQYTLLRLLQQLHIQPHTVCVAKRCTDGCC